MAVRFLLAVCVAVMLLFISAAAHRRDEKGWRSKGFTTGRRQNIRQDEMVAPQFQPIFDWKNKLSWFLFGPAEKAIPSPYVEELDQAFNSVSGEIDHHVAQYLLGSESGATIADRGVSRTSAQLDALDHLRWSLAPTVKRIRHLTEVEGVVLFAFLKEKCDDISGVELSGSGGHVRIFGASAADEGDTAGSSEWLAMVEYLRKTHAAGLSVDNLPSRYAEKIGRTLIANDAVSVHTFRHLLEFLLAGLDSLDFFALHATEIAMPRKVLDIDVEVEDADSLFREVFGSTGMRFLRFHEAQKVAQSDRTMEWILDLFQQNGPDQEPGDIGFTRLAEALVRGVRME